MKTVTIEHVDGNAVAFYVGKNLFYAYFGELVKVYDAILTELMVPNFEEWLAIKSRKNCTYKEFMSMVRTYKLINSRAMTREDVIDICERLVDEITDILFMTDKISYIKEEFKIELMNEHMMIKLIAKIRDNFEEYKMKLGIEQFHQYLCRIYKYCNLHIPDSSDVIIQLFRRLDMPIAEPKYDKLDESIYKEAISRVLGYDFISWKGVSEDVVRSLRKISKLQ